MNDERVPFFLSIDVEPDQKLDVGPHGPTSWSGVAAIRHGLENVRARPEAVTGSEFRVGWYLRMDPQIEALCGTADDAARLFGEDLHRLVSTSGAYLGLHVHATRWHDAEQVWVPRRICRMYASSTSRSDSTRFTDSMGTPPRRNRFTTNVKNPSMAAALEDVLAWESISNQPIRHHSTTSNVQPASRIPRLVRRARKVRGPFPPPQPLGVSAMAGAAARRAARRLYRGPFRQMPVDPYRGKQSPTEFWDDVARSISDLPRPYVSIAFRAERQDSWEDARHRALLEALIDHRLARTVRFADPQEIAVKSQGRVTAKR